MRPNGSFGYGSQIRTIRSAFGNWSGFRITASTSVKIAVFASIPKPSISTAVMVNPGDFRRKRMVWRRWRTAGGVGGVGDGWENQAGSNYLVRNQFFVRGDEVEL